MPSLKRVGGHDIAFSFIFELCSNTPNLHSERLVISTANIRTPPNDETKNILDWDNEVFCIRRKGILLTYSCGCFKRQVFIIIRSPLRLESVM